MSLCFLGLSAFQLTSVASLFSASHFSARVGVFSGSLFLSMSQTAHQHMFIRVIVLPWPFWSWLCGDLFTSGARRKTLGESGIHPSRVGSLLRFLVDVLNFICVGPGFLVLAGVFLQVVWMKLATLRPSGMLCWLFAQPNVHRAGVVAGVDQRQLVLPVATTIFAGQTW